MITDVEVLPHGWPDRPMRPPEWTPATGLADTNWPAPVNIDEALVCGICGVMTPREGASHSPIVRGGWSAHGHPAARICPVCKPAGSGSRGRPADVVDGLVDLDDPAVTAVFRAVRWFSELTRSHPWMPGWAERWAFVDRGAIDDIVVAVHRSLEPQPNQAGYGCGGCGVAAASSWGQLLPASSGGYRQLCPACDELLTNVGLIGYPFTEALAVQAAGLTQVPHERFAELIGFRVYADAAPAGAGTRRRFEWLGADLGRLREQAALRWPDLVVGADHARLNAERQAALRERLADETSRPVGLRLDGLAP